MSRKNKQGFETLSNLREWHEKKFKAKLTASLKEKKRENKTQYIYELRTSFRNHPFFGTGSRKDLALERAINQASDHYLAESNPNTERHVRNYPLYLRK